MYGLVKNDMQLTVQKGIQTFIVAGAIAVGILLVLQYVRYTFQKRKNFISYNTLQLRKT